MFRGIGLFFLFQILLTFNIHSWQKHKMEYKSLFNFKTDSFQNAHKFMKVSILFLILYVTILLSYQLAIFIFQLDINKITGFYYSPLLLYIFYISFLFFPSKKCFMGESRYFALKKIANCITFGFVPTVFYIIFITD